MCVLGRKRLSVMVAACSMLMAMVGVASAAVDRCLAVSSVPGVQQFAGPRMMPFVVREVPPAPIVRVATKLAPFEARITFIGHSTFLIESPDGVRIATDYNDYHRPIEFPDVVTMNRTHDGHYTNFPSPTIKHILRGWNPAGGPAKHDIEYKDVHVRNVPTNIRLGDTGQSYGAYGNSIFIFQLAGMCIGHLGHLHHTLTPDQLAIIGQLDIVLVPVDGAYTMDLAGMTDVVRTLRARLIIPMHYFNRYTLDRFVERVRGEWPVEMSEKPSIVVSQRTLPTEAKVLVLPGP
jgi:L-ascorbate metabolism protein UlaG (beta-lactamase superfamily)